MTKPLKQRTLREWREQEGLTQRGAGARLGISQQTVCDLEAIQARGGATKIELLSAFRVEAGTRGAVPARSFLPPDILRELFGQKGRP